jgi:small neutral amino acid transporter SnatA (MarC family)
MIIFSTYLAFIYSTFIVRIIGWEKFVNTSEIIGLSFVSLGANMLIHWIKTKVII